MTDAKPLNPRSRKINSLNAFFFIQNVDFLDKNADLPRTHHVQGKNQGWLYLLRGLLSFVADMKQASSLD